MEKSENALPCYCEMNNFCFFSLSLVPINFIFFLPMHQQPSESPHSRNILQLPTLFDVSLSLPFRFRVHALLQCSFFALFLCLSLTSFLFYFLSSALIVSYYRLFATTFSVKSFIDFFTREIALKWVNYCWNLITFV